MAVRAIRSAGDKRRPVATIKAFYNEMGSHLEKLDSGMKKLFFD